MSDKAALSFVARYSDKTGSNSRDVRVRLTDDGIAIEQPDGTSPGGQPLRWRYRSLSIAEPLSAHSIDALLASSDHPGAALFVPDKMFARSLASHAPLLTTRSHRRRATRAWIWAAGTVIASLIAVWMSGISPAKAVASLLPSSAREMLGEQVVGSITRDRATCTAPAGLAALDQLTARLSAAAGTRQKFKVVVIDWDVLNAFATPGERIVLTRALIESAKSPDEVAGVLAHEMGHGIELHPEAGIVRGIGLAAATELIFGGAGGSLANIGVLLTQLSYSREAEREADAHALKILKAAKVSPHGLLDFFDRIAKTEKDGDGPPGVFRSHPQTQERREVVAAAGGYSATPALTAQDWAALQGLCSVTTSIETDLEQEPDRSAPSPPRPLRPGETDS